MEQDKDYGCKCPHYKAATKELHAVQLMPLPGCPPDYKIHCCEERKVNCIGVYLRERADAEARSRPLKDSFNGGRTGLRMSGTIRPPSPWSKDQMIAECKHCHKVVGCREMDEVRNAFPTDPDDDKNHWYCRSCAILLTCERCQRFVYGQEYAYFMKGYLPLTLTLCWLCYMETEDPQLEVDKCARCENFVRTESAIGLMEYYDSPDSSNINRRGSICKRCYTLETGNEATDEVRTVKLDHLPTPHYNEHEAILMKMRSMDTTVDEETDVEELDEPEDGKAETPSAVKDRKKMMTNWFYGNHFEKESDLPPLIPLDETVTQLMEGVKLGEK